MPELQPTDVRCRAVVIWIDWYAYHLARFEGLQQAFGTQGEVVGIELVGGVGVHAGLHFRQDRSADLPVRTLLPKSSWKDAGQLTLARMVWTQLTELNPQSVLVPGYYTLPAIAAALWTRLHGRTSVLMTESTAGDHPRSAWKEWLKSALLRSLFQWAVCGGRAHIQYLRQLGFPADRIAHFYDVVGNDDITSGVSQLRESGSSAEPGLPRRFFLFVGRLAAEKNVRGLWSAWVRYRTNGGTWGLVFAGEGPERSSLEAAAQAAEHADQSNALCCEDVVFAGHRSAADLLPLYAAASAFVLPSIREPWGLVVNEAMAAGLPVIVSNRCGCAPTLVEPGQNGMIFDPAQEEDLVHCLQCMEALSESERCSMGRASLDRIAEYSPDNFGRQIEAIARSTERARAVSTASQKEGA